MSEDVSKVGRRTCRFPGCDEPLRSDNTSGHCKRHYQRGALPHRKAAEAWLDDVGLADSSDPNAVLLKSVADELDDLDTGVYEGLTDKQKLDATRASRNAFASARKALQAEVDRADSEAKRRRHQLIYATIAGEALGFCDLALLSDGLRAKVATELREQHGIDVSIYDNPIRRDG